MRTIIHISKDELGRILAAVLTPHGFSSTVFIVNWNDTYISNFSEENTICLTNEYINGLQTDQLQEPKPKEPPQGPKPVFDNSDDSIPF